MKIKFVLMVNSKLLQNSYKNIDCEFSYKDDQGMPVLRNTANARERARMRVLSSAFYRLKTIIPWVPHDTKLSKLDTLRLARNYIAYLSATLDGQPVKDMPNKIPHPQKMVITSPISVSHFFFVIFIHIIN